MRKNIFSHFAYTHMQYLIITTLDISSVHACTNGNKKNAPLKNKLQKYTYQQSGQIYILHVSEFLSKN